MDKRGFNTELNRLKDLYPDKLILIEGIQRAFNRDVPSISRANLFALYQNPAQFMMKKALPDGMWTTQLHEWADNGVEDLLNINPIYLGAKNSLGDTVLMNMVEYAIGKTTEQINFDLLKKLLENPLVFEYKTSEDEEMCQASVWDIKDVTGRTPIDYLSDMASGTGTCKDCEPITEIAPMIAEWASIMREALPEEYADVPEVAEQYVEEQPPTEDEILDAITEYNLCDGECEACDGDECPSVSEPVSEPYTPETGVESDIVDEAPADNGVDDELIPEEARAMIHDEVGKDPFIRDTGNVERIVMAKPTVTESVAGDDTEYRTPTYAELKRLIHKSSENEHQKYRNDWEQNKDAIIAEDEQFADGVMSGSAVALTKTGDDIVIYTPQDSGYFIWELYVNEALRGQGIGSELIQEVLDRAGDLPVCLCVAKDNTGAQNLYEKFGFRKCGETPEQYKMIRG